MTSINVQTTFTQDELAAEAAALGMTVGQLTAPTYPTLRGDVGYRVKVQNAEIDKATNGKSAGADQLKVRLIPCDKAGKCFYKGAFNAWFTFPFENESFKFGDAQEREDAVRDSATIIRQVMPALNILKSVRVGNASEWYDRATDKRLTGAELNTAFMVSRVATFKALKSVLDEGKAAVFNGAIMYLVYNVWTNAEGKTYRGIKKGSLSGEPRDGQYYEYDFTKMLASEAGDTAAATAASADLF